MNSIIKHFVHQLLIVYAADLVQNSIIIRDTLGVQMITEPKLSLTVGPHTVRISAGPLPKTVRMAVRDTPPLFAHPLVHLANICV